MLLLVASVLALACVYSLRIPEDELVALDLVVKVLCTIWRPSSYAERLLRSFLLPLLLRELDTVLFLVISSEYALSSLR